jgi:hypothetical protein
MSADVPAVAFYQKLDAFMFSLHKLKLSYSQRTKLRNLIVKHVLGLVEHHQVKSMAVRLNCFEEYRCLKHNYLDVSWYLGKVLWMEVLKSLKGMEYGHRADVRFCLGCLDPESLEAFRKKNINADLERLDLNAEEWSFLNNTGLYQYARYKVRRLLFLTSDPSLDQEDLVQDLACEIIKTLNNFQRRYKRERNSGTPLKAVLDKYIDTAVNNRIMHLIDHHNRKKRKFLYARDNEKYEKLKKLGKGDGNGEEMERLKKDLAGGDYYSLCMPYDCFSETESGESSFNDADNIHTYRLPDYEAAESYMFIEGVKQDVDDPRLADFIDIVTYGDEKFERWADENGYAVTKSYNAGRAAKIYIDLLSEQGAYDDRLTERQKKMKWRTTREARKRINRINREVEDECR